MLLWLILLLSLPVTGHTLPNKIVAEVDVDVEEPSIVQLVIVLFEASLSK